MELSILFGDVFKVEIPALSKDTLIKERFTFTQELDVRKSKVTWTNDLRFFVSHDSTTQVAVSFQVANNEKFVSYFHDLQYEGNNTIGLVSRNLSKRKLKCIVEITIYRKLNSGSCLIQFDSSDVSLLFDK